VSDASRAGVIAVTGTSRGIGARIAIALGRRGFRVGCLSRGGKGPEDVAVPADVAPRLVAHRCDVNDEDAVRQALAVLAAEPGGLRGLVNNAGIYFKTPSASMTTAELEQVMQTNAVSVFQVSREAYPHLAAGGGGLIVNIGSLFDKQGVSRHLAYCASKAAVAAMTRCLAVEWASKGIIVMNVAPGYVETDFNREFLARDDVREWMKRRNPVGRAGTADEVAALVASLFVEQNPYLTGETIYLDGGQGIAH
jgi:NAD(P)-dependent dehydrogenase (short-subunit alcohol dehydrogenase family)